VGAEQDKLLVRGLVEGITNGSLEVLDEVADDRFARAARQRIGPFRDSFPDFRMEVTGLIADEEKVAVHLRCSDTHLGQWRGHQPSGLRFWGVDEIYIYRVRGGRLVAATGVEDNPARMRQFGLPA
jgi:predicted ester cyclase